MQKERRLNRSSFPAVALELALDSVKARSGAHACLIADDQGLLVAGIGAGFNLTQLAVFARPGNEQRLVDEKALTQGMPMHSAPISIGGAQFYYASVGGSPVDPKEIEAAAQRLFE